jgi:hypothetical protein
MRGDAEQSPDDAVERRGDDRLAPVGYIAAIKGQCEINRNGGIIQPDPGDPVFENDILRTDASGEATIVFIDGGCLSLSADARATVQGFSYKTGSAGAAHIKAEKGRFAFLGGEIAKHGNLVVETPKAKIRSREWIGAGAFAFAFVLSLIEEANAISEELTLIDDEKITVKELTHGVFEIITKGPNPEVFIVDDPGRTFVLRPRGTTISVEVRANDISTLSQLQNLYKEVHAAYSAAQQDGFIQQQGGQRAAAAGSATDALGALDALLAKAINALTTAPVTSTLPPPRPAGDPPPDAPDPGGSGGGGSAIGGSLLAYPVSNADHAVARGVGPFSLAPTSALISAPARSFRF